LEQVPPHNADVERAALGAMLVDSRACQIAIDELSTDDFYITFHRKIFETAKAMCAAGLFPDNVTMVDALQGEDLSDDETMAIVSKLVMQCPTAGNIESYCSVIREKSRERARIIAAGQLLFGATAADVKTALDKAEESPRVTTAG
jgi:replicative DNA helicase